jgi:hypothetical protein
MVQAAMSRILVPLLATLLLAVPPPSLASEVSYNFRGESPELTVVRGRAVCLDSSGREVGSLFGCPESVGFGFAGKDGRLYRFMASDTMASLFTDNRVRQRELQITARLHERDQLEIIKVQSVKAGKLYDIFYYCDVCSITAYVPGLCPCCRNQLEFRETPQ